MDELLRPANAHCAGIRSLMLEELERELSLVEARRIEHHVESCSGCQSVLAGADLPLPAVPLPSADEWREVDAALRAATGRRGEGRPQWRPASPGQGVPVRRWWRSALLPAAATLLIVLALWGPGEGPLPPVSDELTAVEILEVPDDTSAVVQTFDEESDGVMIFFVSG